MEVKTKRPLSVRALSMLLSVLMIAGVFSIIDIGTLRTQALVSGDYEYKVLDNGTISITDYKGNDTEIVIPSIIDGKKVTEIGYGAFSYSNLTSVIIPNGVTTIDSVAFCFTDLTSVSIPNSVTTIGNSAFEYTDLPSVSIPNSVKTIGEYAFCTCDSLTSISIPGSVQTIEYNTFMNCHALKTVYISEGVKTIEKEAFLNCSKLEKVSLPSTLTTIKTMAFDYCVSLTGIDIPINVTMIEDDAFYGCQGLKYINVSDGNKNYCSADGVLFSKDKKILMRYPNVSGDYTIPDGVTEIKDKAFSFCNGLTNMYIPGSVTTMGDRSFEYCDHLISFNVSDKNNNYCSVDGVLFNKDKTTLIIYPSDKVGEYIIPDSVETIKTSAFYHCESLTSVTIPVKVTKLKEHTFIGCRRLISVYIPESTTEIAEKAFETCGTFTIYGFAGSCAESYANKRNSPFSVLAELKNNSTVTASTIVLGQEITLKGVATGGTGGYQYAMFAKHNTESNYTVLKKYDTTASKNWKPSETGIYSVIIKVKDTSGAVVKKEFTITVNAVLTNKSTVTATTVISGQGITLKGVATGGTGGYQYAMFAKHSTESDYTILKKYSTTAAKDWKPSKTGTYSVIIKVKDSSGEVVEKEFTITVKPALANKSTVTATSVVLGQNITLKGTATGGTGGYQYAMFAKHNTESDYTVLKKYSTTAAKDWKPSKTGTYSVIIKVKDTSGAVVKKEFTITVKPALTNKSTVTATTVTLGQGITLKGVATGGTGTYQYAMVAKHSTASKYTVLKNYNSTATTYWKPSKTGTYHVIIKVKDSSGKVVQKGFTITVNAVLTNKSTVTTTTVTLGQGITLKGVATGGTGTYQYAMVAKHSTASKYTVLKNYNSTATTYWKPSKTGTYHVIIKVKDSSGEVVQKGFTITVNAVLTNKSTVTATNITSGQGITLKGTATGGTGGYQYAMVAKHSTASKYTVLKNYNSTATTYWKPSKTGTYHVIIKVKDSSGKVVQKGFTITVK